MYERSAIVLERYIEKILNFTKRNNLRKNYENYTELIHEIENYQVITEKELKFIQEFDEKAKKIESLQKEQERFSKTNKNLEEERTLLFGDLGEDTKVLESKLSKIESTIGNNNERLKEIREKYIENLSDFSQKQKERNRCEKARRVGETKHIQYIKNANAEFGEIDAKEAYNLKDYINSEKEQVKKEVLEIMIKNGKSEKVAFNEDVLKKAIKARIDISQKEAECYLVAYDKMKKLLQEIESEAVKLTKFQKALRDTTVKLAFLRAEKEYIVAFLDYERMTTVSGIRVHKKMMTQACNNFELDMMQIRNLYELLLKEITGKATKKAYKELYNKTYLREIEDKEKNFEKEVNNVSISMGTVINSNYWRIEGIKNIYETFQREVSEKFGKDLSEYRIEELEEEEEEKILEQENDNKLYKFEIYENDEDDDYEDDLYKFKIYDDEEDDEEDEEEEEYDEEEYDEEYEEEEEMESDEEEWDEEEQDDDNDEYDESENIFDYGKKVNKRKLKNTFDEEDSLESIIERSRKKGLKERQQKDNKTHGLFNKLFKK